MGNSWLESPWFGAAAASGVAVDLLTRDNGDPQPVRIEWGNR